MIDGEPLRVLVLYLGRRGGGAHYTASVVESLVAQSADVEAFVLHEVSVLGRLQRAGAAVHALRLSGVRSALGVLRGLRRHIRNAPPDVAIVTMIHPLIPLAICVLRANRMPVAFVVHDAAPHSGDRRIVVSVAEAMSRRVSTALFAPTVFVSSELRRRYRRETSVVPLGSLVELPDCWDPNGKILFFGRLARYKGLDLLADAWATVGPTDVELRVVGEPGKSAREHIDLLRSLSVTVEERWVSDDEIPGVLLGTRLMVLPYRDSSQSGVAELAKAAKIPVLATDVGGTREQFATGGALIVAPDAAELGTALRRLLSDTSTLRELRGELVRNGPAASAHLTQALRDLARERPSGRISRRHKK